VLQTCSIRVSIDAVIIFFTLALLLVGDFEGNSARRSLYRTNNDYVYFVVRVAIVPFYSCLFPKGHVTCSCDFYQLSSTALTYAWAWGRLFSFNFHLSRISIALYLRQQNFVTRWLLLYLRLLFLIKPVNFMRSLIINLILVQSLVSKQIMLLNSSVDCTVICDISLNFNYVALEIGDTRLYLSRRRTRKQYRVYTI
jgi:hypothetical protein